MKKFTWAVVVVVLFSCTVVAQGGYMVGAGDVLNITVFGEPDLSGKFPVDGDGAIAYPQLGRVKTAGMTLREVEEVLKKLLADGYLKEPQVAASVDTNRSQRVLIMGEVRTPGEYELGADLSLLAALVRAGGPTPTAGREVVIVRPAPRTPGTLAAISSAEAEIFRVDLAALQAGNLSLNVQLQDGDTISVPKLQSVFLTGQVKSPGAYSVERNTTVLQVLALAGGLTDRGSDARIRILRIVKGRKTEIRAKMSDAVEPGDTIVVPERFF